MTFLNVILLFGLAAASIPLIIHLLHRSRFRVVKWAAMQFLEVHQRTQRRRIRIEQLLLLLVRCLIPAVLALIMARPVLTGLRALLGAAKTSTVILLDNSYSMDVGTKNHSTFTEARDTAGQLIRHLGRGSEVAVVLMGGVPAPLLAEPTFNTDRAARELALLQTGYGSANVPAALDLGLGILGKMHEVQRELIVISDFQKISWAERDDIERTRLAGLLKKLPVTPTVSFVHPGSEDRNNVSVQSLDFSRMLLGVGQKFQVRANLKNHGDTAYGDLRVYFRVDGTERAASQLSLGPNEAGQVLFTYTFETAGSHVIAVSADAPDSLKSDNSLLASVPVLEKLPVLVVNGKPGREPLEGETDFLEIALRPFQNAKGNLTDLIATRVIETPQLDANALKDVRVVVLANIAQLQDHQTKALEAFVRAGGGLLVFPGSRVDTAWWNHALAPEERGLLPYPLTALEGGLEDNAAHSTILMQHFEHPALQLFNDPRNGDLSTANIRLWYKLAITAATPAKTNASVPFVLGRLSSGDPFLVEKAFGDGSVILCTVPCSAEWSNLPMRPFYLPLMQQLVTYLAAKFDPPRNVDIGRPLVAVLPVALGGKQVELTDPDGKKHKLDVSAEGGRALAHYEATRQPGLYILSLPDQTLVHFVVNTSRTESDLAQLTGEEIATAAKPFDATLVKSWDEYRQLEQRRRYGRDVW
ncbi:MAG: BatA domain-containing protein, partial [Kiritimatiellaeota bacterium]|nr:BatA domain-containing protein [Kiritimatiellota bacterium]